METLSLIYFGVAVVSGAIFLWRGEKHLVRGIFSSLILLTSLLLLAQITYWQHVPGAAFLILGVALLMGNGALGHYHPEIRNVIIKKYEDYNRTKLEKRFDNIRTQRELEIEFRAAKVWSEEQEDFYFSKDISLNSERWLLRNLITAYWGAVARKKRG